MSLHRMSVASVAAETWQKADKIKASTSVHGDTIRWPAITTAS
jgi:hypothetical protein